MAQLFGKMPTDILRTLSTRRESSYKPGSYSDGNKIALIFEGGAMAGLYSSAAGTALQELGFTTSFDVVYGTSAGAINAAYFVAGQSKCCTLAYENEVISDEFMGIARWPDQIDVHWLSRNLLLNGPRKLDIEEVNRSALQLKLSMTDVESGKSRFYSSKHDPIEQLVPAIRASGSTPHFTTHSEKISGRAYNDGVIRAPIATIQAIEDGANMLVLLLTRPKGRIKRFGIVRSIFEYVLRLRHYSAEYQNSFYARHAFYNDSFDAIHSEKIQCSLALSPESTPLRSLEKRKTLISIESEKHIHDVTNAILVNAGH